MNEIILPNIPRAYTALAELLACFVFILPLKKRNNWLAILPFMGLGQYLLQYFVSYWDIIFWIPGMILNVCWMFLTIYVCTQVTFKDSSYVTAKAFIIAEFTAAFSWQLYCHLFLNNHSGNRVVEIIANLVFFLAIYTVIFLIEKRVHRSEINITLQSRNVFTAIFTATIIFTMSNIGFILSVTAYSFNDPLSIFILRTMINFCGICILYLQENQQYEHYLQNELKAVNNIFQNQYEQYLAYKESSAIIERKVHDLKHQIDVIRAEKNSEKKEAYLDEMTQAINSFNSNIQTGHGVLDTILSRKNIYCIENDIRFTCIVDGQLLDFMNVMDICSLFGNSLDNAIESVLHLSDITQRLVNLRVFKRESFVMISLENYTTETLKLTDGLPKTTKENEDYHGYGLKSISYIAEKYEGTMTISTENNWFSLKLLFPLKS